VEVVAPAMDLEELAAPARSTDRPSTVALSQASTFRLDLEVRIEKGKRRRRI
jgi:hypothetical protein